MKSTSSLILVILIIQLSCSPSKTKWDYLFNGEDLDKWETYIGPRFDTSINTYDTIPVGLNNDPAGVFSLVDLENEKVLRISGENFGGISTLKEFENYHLQLQFKWGTDKWVPRKVWKRDSGVLYHCNGPHAGDGRFWMRSQEFQVQEGDCGDYWGVAGAIMDIRAEKDSTGKYIYNKDGELTTFGAKSPNGRNCKKYPDAENPYGEWNTLEIYCFENTSYHFVNGVLTMVLENSRQLVDGEENTLTRGKIQLQSEGAELFYKNIRIRSIDELPVL